MGGVFISYRREDAAGYAGRIYDRLLSRLGRERVFIDVDNIPAGLDFVDVLSERVGRCDALIAIVGRNWLGSADKNNRRRLDDPNDFVRIEIEAALNRNVPVIPVLVDGAVMPQADELPDGLKKLARRQGIEISHSRFDSDAERLTDALAEIEEQQQGAHAEAAPAAAQSRARAIVGAPASSEATRAAAPLGGSPPASAPPKPTSRRFLPYLLALAVLAGVAATVWLAPRQSNRSGNEWLTLDAFQAEFNKKTAAGFYPDASSGRCNGGVIKTNAHWAATPPGLAWSHYNLPEAAFASRNAQLTAQGYSLRYDNMFEDCEGRVRHVALWMRLGAGTTPTHAGIEHFLGEWINVDANTRSIPKLSVSLAGKDVSVHAWGACHPTPCDWGEVKAETYAENVSSNAITGTAVLRGVFKTSFAETNFSAQLDGEDKLRFETATHFTDNSGRANYSSTDMFKRAP
jgi:hypothetical protein